MTDSTPKTAGHTPGPWRVSECFAYGGYDIETDDALIAEIREEIVTSEDNAEKEANARLIAAAPDLLAAAIRAVDTLEWAENELDGDMPPSTALQELRAAIAKATGQSTQA